jgi:hypothetical protein
MSSNAEYNEIVLIFNKKEEELKNKIKFYKENMDQLVRIKMLEAELEGLEGKVSEKYHTNMSKKRKEDIMKLKIEYCSQNCKEAFDKYIYQKNHYEMTGQRFNRDNELFINVNVSGLLGCGQFRFYYTFDKIDSKKYNITCSINNNHNDIVKGVYDIDDGFSICE